MADLPEDAATPAVGLGPMVFGDEPGIDPEVHDEGFADALEFLPGQLAQRGKAAIEADQEAGRFGLPGGDDVQEFRSRS